ncbi:MAG: MFS transporter [Candidatus Cellulosilyticum pullistercoris]|uniref:MFS transporter n=1 Tax=Candidatus Cellulosilyticum pullistercoris TaxID=2838521 RepID=A0A9E2NJW4_9FIRM|nr:MFS transporter [Candidatus Cellulosilyticum pullistercoris]
MNKKDKFFYGWWIVIASFMIMTFLYTPIVNLVSLYTKPVTEELAIGRTQFNTYYTIMALVSMVACPIAGKLMRKYDIRLYLTVCTVLGALSYIGFAFSTKLMHFYLLAIPMGISLAGAAIIPTSVLITNWFVDKRGLSLGIALSGSGFGGIILSPINNWIISTFSWRASYLITGISILVLIVPFTMFVIRFSPADLGLLAYGENKVSTNKKSKELVGITQSQAIKSVSFWALCLAIVVSGVVVNSMIVNLSPYLTDIGASAQTAALILSLSSAMVIVGKLYVGRIFDKLGLKTVLLIIGISNIASFVFLLKGNLLIPAVLYAVFTGFGATAVTVTPSYITASLYGEKEYGAKYGIVSLFSSLGAAICPIVSGSIYNINNSYTTLLYVLIVLALVATGLFLLAAKTKPKFEGDQAN